MNNLNITDSPEALEGWSLLKIDAKKCRTLKDLFETMAELLQFPDYFGFNLDSFDELMNDLSWIEDERVLIYFFNSEAFLINERNEKKVIGLLDQLDATCEDWKYYREDEVELEEGEEAIPAKELLITFSPSARMNEVLEVD